MLRAETLAIRRKVREHKAGFEVKDDPWELVEEFLQENERLRLHRAERTERGMGGALMSYTGSDAAERNREAHKRYVERNPEKVRDSHRESRRRSRERKRAEIRRAKALDGSVRTNYVGKDILHEGPRRPCVVCKVCFGLPWARRPERRGDGRGDSALAERPPVVGEDGLCLGCGLPYSPEPEPRRDSGVRSSAAMALPWARE